MKCSPALLLCLTMVPAFAGAMEYAPIPGGEFRSAIRYDDAGEPQRVAPFLLMTTPVSNADFARFVHQHPQWQRDRLPAVFASDSYLKAWSTPRKPGSSLEHDAAVTQVNWYAANAYCRAHDARLPTFLEWEYAAAADARQRDARDDSHWMTRQLDDGTARAIDAPPDAVANVYGIRELHGAVWEWTDDFSSLLGATDRRGQDDGNMPRFCGATALAFDDRRQYGVQKRFAVLSALDAADTLANLGFRCARSLP